MTDNREQLLRWLAPIIALGLLGYLVLRVSSCGPPATTSLPPRSTPPQPAAEPPPADPPPDLRYTRSLEFLGATKAAPQVVGDSLFEQSHRQPEAEPAPQVSEP
jgi:hypothetical protein